MGKKLQHQETVLKELYMPILQMSWKRNTLKIKALTPDLLDSQILPGHLYDSMVGTVRLREEKFDKTMVLKM
jgi:hypothetical protein